MNATISFTVNGKSQTVTTDPDRPLLDVLREDLQLTGAKYGCGEGQCRACTVLVGGKIIDGKPTGTDEIRGRAIEGATKYPIAAGDTLYIPANTVHQFLVEPGKNFTAMVVKITPKP